MANTNGLFSSSLPRIQQHTSQAHTTFPTCLVLRDRLEANQTVILSMSSVAGNEYAWMLWTF